MKVPKQLLVRLIKTMYPDKEKQETMLAILDKLDLNSLQSTADVTKVLNNPESLKELAGTAGQHDGSDSHVDIETKVIAAETL